MSLNVGGGRVTLGGPTADKRMRLTEAGNVGIGTTSPNYKLEVNGDMFVDGTSHIEYLNPRIGTGDPYRYIRFGEPDEFYAGLMWNNTDPAFGDGDDFTIFTYNSRDIVLRPTGTGELHILDGDVGIGTTSPSSKLHVNGKLTVTGSDFAERFHINTINKIDSETMKGMLVVIDERHEGQLILCTEAYDKKVAGIVSGANGVRTGLVMGEPNTLADGDIPVAMSGRVYCYADANYGKIEMGDLLTTSPTEGHAMKAKRFKKSQGAVIGKAMTSLEEGKGLILVLINPQ